MPDNKNLTRKPHELVCCECVVFAVATGNLVHVFCDACQTYLSSYVASELRAAPYRAVLVDRRVP